MNDDLIQETLNFFRQVGHLKSLPRQGWVQREVPDPESVADHSFRVVLMAMVLGEREGVDQLRLLKMCLIHDLPETIVGDFTPHDGITDIEKNLREESALREITSRLPEGQQYLELWLEYEQGASPEARLAREIDKLEMALQASEYQDAFPGIDLSEFHESVSRALASGSGNQTAPRKSQAAKLFGGLQ